MRINKLISIGKWTSVAILVLGIIHDIATFTPLIKGGLSCLSPDNLSAMMYMSLICGTSFILSGLLLLTLLKKIEQFPFLVAPIMIIGSFLAVSCVLSMVYMYENPFAWIAFVLNTIMFGVALRLKIKLSKE